MEQAKPGTEQAKPGTDHLEAEARERFQKRLEEEEAKIQFTEEELDAINKRVEERMKKDYVQEMILDDIKDSDFRVPGQNFCVMSFAGEKCKPRSDYMALRIWGCFETCKEATDHAVAVGKHPDNENFNVFVTDMYAWGVVPPDMSLIGPEHRIYHDTKLNEIVTDHHRQKIHAEEMFGARKEKMLELNRRLREEMQKQIQDENKEQLEKTPEHLGSKKSEK